MTGNGATADPRGDEQRVLLRLKQIDKSYDGIHALRDASFELRCGEVHALVGENGAGKSTLIKIVTGAVPADAGRIEFDGQPIADNSPARARELGIAAIYQQPALFPELTVAENIALGLEPGGIWHRVNWRRRKSRAHALLEKINAQISVDEDAGNLSMPQQQLVEIARALGANARVLILDEPTASLSDEAAERLLEVITQLRAQRVGIIYISHRLEELSRIADRVTVLRDGAVVGTQLMAETNRDELIRLMVGRELSQATPGEGVKSGPVVLELKGAGSAANGIRNINLAVHAGEIFGLAGLVGAGRTELARALFGLESIDSGEMIFGGRPVHWREPADAIEQGIAYVPEDRRHHGVILDMPVSANVTLALLRRLGRWQGFDFAAENDLANEYVQRFAIKTPSIFAPVSALSGGNQQKVALSRWLATKPSLLILDEPTQGIDIGAKGEIHELIRRLAQQGMAILMISSELPEILATCDRVAVMRERTIVGILDRADATQQKILSLAFGHEAEASVI